jgi:hypothetical protein
MVVNRLRFDPGRNGLSPRRSTVGFPVYQAHGHRLAGEPASRATRATWGIRR